jgi:uncharacterized OsmC-like protein
VTNQRTADAINAASTYLGNHPSEAKAIDSVATATLLNGLVVRVTGPGAEEVTTDMVQSVGGTDSAPSPGWLLRAAEASCVATVIAMRAAVLGISLSTLSVEFDSESDDRGILGLDETIPPGPLKASLRVHLAADGVRDSALRELAEWGVAHCPIHDALERSIPIATEITSG